MKSGYNFVVISDLHLGVGRLNTSEMVKALILWLEKELAAKPKYLFITGDIYHTLLDADSKASKAINSFFSWICTRCSQLGIKLWALKGTTNHDYRQVENLVSINEGLLEPCELRYFDEVGVHVEDGVSYLVVPDNAATTIDGVRALVEVALKDAGLEQVDVALTHGMYSHHALAEFSHDSHDFDFYLSIVKTLIINGHIHTTSLRKHLLTVGSFDRCAQGEEEAKGGYRGYIDAANESFELTFVENKYATIMRAVEVGSDITSDDEAFNYIDNFVGAINGIERGGYISVVSLGGLDLKTVVERLNVASKGHIIYSVKTEKSAKKKDTTIEFKKLETKPITPNTFVEMMLEKLARDNVVVNDYHHEIMKEIA